MLLRLTLLGAALYYLSTIIDFSEVPAAMARLSLWGPAVMLGLTYVALGLGVLRWRVLLTTLGACRLPPLRTLYRLYLVASFYNTFVPGGVGGELVRGYASRHAFSRDGASQGILAVFAERAMGLSGLMLLVAVALLLRPLPGVPNTGAFALLGLAGAAAAVVGLRHGRTLGRLLPPALQRWTQRLPAARHSAPLLLSLLLSLATQALAAISGHAIVHTTAPDVPLSFSLVAIPLATATMFLPSIAGLGFFEGAFVALYALAGVPEVDALAACLAYRLCLFAVSATGGLLPVPELASAQAETGGAAEAALGASSGAKPRAVSDVPDPTETGH